jgi:hypothetical protein
MSPCKPPRLATWLLNRFGFVRQNPPLVGDLLEEFRAGRSTAWFWRQTLIVILTGFAGNARRFRRLLVARLIGWATGGVVAFGFWLCHPPPRVDGLIGLSSGMALLSLWCLLAVREKMRRRRSGAETLSDVEQLEEWSVMDEVAQRRTQRLLMQAYAGTWFIVCLMVYGIVAFLIALSGSISLWAFFLFQVQLLVGSVNDVLAPSKEPGLAITLLTQ